MDLFFNIVGNVGVIGVLAAYLLLQKGTWAADSYPYLVINIVAAMMVVASLCWDWNLPAFLLEFTWGLISLYGLIKRYRKDRAVT